MPNFIYRAKTGLKSHDFIRDNYRRMRKIFLHIVHGRFYSALKLSNHYNPVYRIIIRNPIYLKKRQKKHLARALKKVYSYPGGGSKQYNVKLILREGDFLPKSSAFIRLIGPLSDPSVSSKINLLIESPQVMTSNLGMDFVIVQRTVFDNLKDAKKLIAQTKGSRMKIIVDTDDAFHNIDESHPEYYQQTRRNEAVQYLMDHAAQVWVSTEQLVDSKLADKTIVMPNSLDPRLWQAGKVRTNTKGSVRMLYMGTVTHDADLGMIIPALDKLNEKYPGAFSLTVIGVSQDLPDRPWVTRLTTPYLGSLYPSFVEWFMHQGPFDIGLSPLVDSAFNRSKSDIKCLDYLGAGIMPVVSDILPYRGKDIADFIIKVKNDEGAWSDALSKIVADPDKFRTHKAAVIAKAQNYIWEDRASDRTAKTLLKNLEDLAD